MKNEEIFTHWSKILDKLFYNPYSYWSAYFQMPFSRDSEYGNRVNDRVELFCGVSRGTLVDKGYDWVVKFPLTYEGDNAGYCDKEVEVFAAAKEQGLSDYFAEAQFIGVYRREIEFWDFWEIERFFNLYEDTVVWEDHLRELIKEKSLGKKKKITLEIPLYAYRKAAHYSSKKMWQLSREDELFAKSSNSPLAKSSLGVAVAFRDWYGLDVFQKLSDFAREHRINDLHSGNIGVIEHRLVFIDYAGFFDDEEENSEYEDEEESGCDC